MAESGDFALQIKEIIEALHDIRSQLAEQNKYLDVLTETYVKKPAEIQFEDDWESEFEGDETQVEFLDDFEVEVKDELKDDLDIEDQEIEWEEAKEVLHEREYVETEAPDASNAPDMSNVADWARELNLPNTLQSHNRYMHGVTATTMFYLPMGIISSFFAMNRFNPRSTPSQTSFNTIFVVLLLAVYIFAACALWFAREEGWIRELLMSWVPTKTSIQGRRAGAGPQRSGFPSPLKRRRAWEPVI